MTRSLSNLWNALLMGCSVVCAVFVWFWSGNWLYSLLSFIPWYMFMDHPEPNWWNEPERTERTKRTERPKRLVWSVEFKGCDCGHNHRTLQAANNCGIKLRGKLSIEGFITKEKLI